MTNKKTPLKKAFPQADLLFSIYVSLSLLVSLGIMVLPKEGFLPARERYLLIGISQTAIIAFSALLGFISARKFSFESSIGKGIALVSAGVASWAIANAIWTGYTLAGVDMPYPSIADVFYLGIIPLALAGAFVLFKSFGLELDAKTAAKYAILPLVAGAFLFWKFFFGRIFENLDPLTRALNIAYPLGDVLFVSFAVFIFFATRSTLMAKPTAILLSGYVLFAIADFGFTLTTASGTYYTGNWVTALFTLGLCVVGAGLYLFKGSIEETQEA